MKKELEYQLEEVTSTFKTFTTNQGTNTLEDKLTKILSRDYIKYFDVLIGYFRISGFNKIENFLENIEDIRILIGISTEKKVLEATELIEEFANQQIEDFNKTTSEEKYNSIISMLQLLKSGRLNIKVSLDNKNHSKLYILRTEKNVPFIDVVGGVIIGSSNLTHNGMSGNFEINTELRQDRDIDEATKLFNVLWDNAVELSDKDIEDKIIPKLKDYPPKPKKITEENITPYQLYIKLLIEHFGSRINFINSDDIFVPNGYKQLSYQIEAVNDGIDKLDKHNGFFLSDVVGLGKTVVTAMLCKKLEPTLKKGILIVIPPAIKSQWEDTFNSFEIKNYDIVSLASLDKVNSSKYELIIVDESHKFKNIKTKRYEKLAKICKDKKVILLSATPQNNSPKDLHSQLNLFQNMKNSTIPTCENLDKFFHNLEPKYQSIINATDGKIDKSSLENISMQIRDKVLRTVMVRRTRTDIENHPMYMLELESQGLTIPKVQPLKEHEYEMKEPLKSIFEKTASILIDELKYERFNALSNLTKEARLKYYPNESDNVFKYNPLATLMQNLLIKRFESSFHAFNISINRQLTKYEEFIKNFKDDRVYLGKRATDILNYDEDSDGDYDEFIDKLIEKGNIKTLSQSDFKDNYLKKLESDIVVLQKLVDLWENNTDDPKIIKFIDEIEKQDLNNNPNKKIVVFTESKDTASYLKSKLINTDKVLFITSENRDDKKQIIRENFDANYEEEKQKNDFNIIVTTDTLSEGINLHRSNIIYNYDIPWNATKLIQRIGRVNRIGTKADFIYVHNFKPSANIEKLIKLSQKAYVKLQAFHTTLGEDNKVYTEDEEVSTVKLFNEYQNASKDKDEELDFLEELRIFRDSNIEEFNNIVNLPKELTISTNGTCTKSYIALDIDDNKNYYCANNTDVKSINFLEIAKALKTTKEEIPDIIKTKENDKHLQSVITYCKESFNKSNKIKAEGKLTKGIEQKTIVFIKRCVKNKLLDKEQFTIIKNAIITGDIDIITANEILKLENSSNENIVNGITNILENIKDNPVDTTTKEQVFNIILTHTFMEK